MNRNLDILWDIVLSLISLPTPLTLYNFLAANPAAFALFLYQSPVHLSNRIRTLTDSLLSRLEAASASANRARLAELSALTTLDALVMTPGVTQAEIHTAMLRLRGLSLEALEWRNNADEALAKAKPILLNAVKSINIPSTNTNAVMDAGFVENCKQLVAWRAFQQRLFGAAAKAALPRRPPKAVNDEFREAILQKGIEEFGELWRRRFFGVGDKGVRRSERIRKLKARRAGGKGRGEEG